MYTRSASKRVANRRSPLAKLNSPSASGLCGLAKLNVSSVVSQRFRFSPLLRFNSSEMTVSVSSLNRILNLSATRPAVRMVAASFIVPFGAEMSIHRRSVL